MSWVVYNNWKKNITMAEAEAIDDLAEDIKEMNIFLCIFSLQMMWKSFNKYLKHMSWVVYNSDFAKAKGYNLFLMQVYLYTSTHVCFLWLNFMCWQLQHAQV